MMKKFISKIVKFLVIIILFIVTVNYVGDSAKLFHPDYVKKIARLLINKSNVTNISNYDERLLQKEIISQIKTAPDILVLGSSRVKAINSEFFKDKKLRNHFVSGATLEDIIAIYQMNISKRIIPKEIILGVDPWIFNEHNGQFRWKVLKNEYYKFMRQPEQTEFIDYDKLEQLFSLSYFQVSLRNLPRVLTGKDQPVATKSKSNLHNIKLSDGSHVYGDVYMNVGIEVVNKRAEQYCRGEVYSLGDFNSISDKKMAEFNKLIQNILDKKNKVNFCTFAISSISI